MTKSKDIDINVGELTSNCFRQSKVDGECMLQMRVPGAVVDADNLEYVRHIAKEWGNGDFHIGTRQTFSIPGINYEDIDEVNSYLKEYIQDVEVDTCGVDMEVDESGFPNLGARNIMGCIGNNHCIKGNVDTTELARKLERRIFPSPYHIKIGVSGCPNDCAKGHFNDFGIIGLVDPEYQYERCIGCEKCVEACESHATGVLEINEDGKIEKDECCCVGCGECVVACPTGAWQRNPTDYYRVTIGGRAGKQYPRLGKMFLNWVTEDVVLGIIDNWEEFSAEVLNYRPVYLHGGHLIDMAGYYNFKEKILEGVELNPKAEVAEHIYWDETEYRANIHVQPCEIE